MKPVDLYDNLRPINNVELHVCAVLVHRFWSDNGEAAQSCYFLSDSCARSTILQKLSTESGSISQIATFGFQNLLATSVKDNAVRFVILNMQYGNNRNVCKNSIVHNFGELISVEPY